MLIDLHVHTDASACSNLSIDDILNHGPELGLDGVCITDHHSMKALDHIVPGQQANGLLVFVGQEYHSDHGDFLIFGPQAPLPPYLSTDKLLTTVADSGGVAIAAHPFRKARPMAESVIRNKMCHIVESINGRNQILENLNIVQWRTKYELSECAGSDAHSLDELGSAHTRFHVPIHSLEDLIYALRNGYCTPYLN